MCVDDFFSIDELKELSDGWKKAFPDMIPGINRSKGIPRYYQWPQNLGNLLASRTTTEKPSLARTEAE